MAAPALFVAAQGQGVISADNINGLEQTCDNFSQLRAVVGLPGMQVVARGQTTPGDGSGGVFYWNATSGAADDNATVLKPTGGATLGRWVILPAQVALFSQTASYAAQSVQKKLQDYNDVRDAPYLAVGNGVANDAGAFTAADGAGRTTWVPKGTYLISGNITLSNALQFEEGASLVVPNGVTVTLNGPVLSGPYQIFSTTGTGAVVLKPSVNPVGYAEWWGAQINNAGFDSSVAIQAAINALPTVQLLPGTYYIASGLTIMNNGTRVLGSGFTQTDQGPNTGATVIMCTSATATIIQVGSSSSTRPTFLTEAVQLRDFTVNRNVAPFIPNSGILGCIGIACRWSVNCHYERVFSINSCRGWFLYGTVECYWERCSALRDLVGSVPANDTFIGFHLDYTAPTGFNGGNASTYLTECRAFPVTGNNAPVFFYSAAARCDQGFVDLFFRGFECGSAIQYGIHGIGDGVASTSFRCEDLVIDDCTLDAATIASIWLEQGGVYSAVAINSTYCAVTAPGTCIVLKNMAGSVALTGNQYIVNGGGTGLSLITANNVTSTGNIYTGFTQPIVIATSTNFNIQDTINSKGSNGGKPAVAIGSSTRGIVECTLAGPASTHTAGVSLTDGGSSLLEIRCTNLNPAPIVGGSGNKLLNNGTQVTTTGTFGTNNLAAGVMV